MAPPVEMGRRTRFRWLLLGIPLAGVLGYGIWLEPNRLEVTHHAVGERKGESPFKLMQISDLHLRTVDNIRKSVAAQARGIQPDLIVLSGDVVDHSASLAELDVFLQSLGGTPKVAVLGNWEYWSGVDLHELGKIYERNHVSLLVNACTKIHLKRRWVDLVGLDDALAGRPNLNKAMAQCAEARDAILIEHSPGFFGKPVEQPDTESPFLLSLAGHTHGGQIALFGHPIALPPGSGAYNRGWYMTRHGRLYVSRGIGTSEVPVRIGTQPEIAVFEIN